MAKDTTALAAYFDLYRLALSYEGKSPKTLETYFSNLNRFAKHLEGRLGRPPVLSDFTPDNVVDFVSVRKLEPRTVGHPDHKVV